MQYLLVHRRSAAVLVLALLIVCSLLLAPLAAAAVKALLPQECEALGFRSSEVQCRFCVLLKQQTQSDQLYDECKSCCFEQTLELTASSANAQYTIAQFAMQDHKHYVENKFLGNTLYDFIEKFKHQPYYSQVQFVESPGTAPRLILYNANKTKKLEVQVKGWSPETMDQFLREKLTVSGGAAAKKE